MIKTKQIDYDDVDIDRPSWLPDEYDPTAPLAERLKLLAPIDGGIELHVIDGRGVTEVVGEPRGLRENAGGSVRLKAGMGPDAHTWNWEIIAPADDSADARLLDVEPDQPIEAYEKTKSEYMSDIDVRVYGVDAPRWLNSPHRPNENDE